MNNFRKLLLTAAVFAAISACKNSSENNEEEQIQLHEETPTTQKNVQNEENVKFAEGKGIYTQYCVTCHQANGSGVPNLNPPLQETQYVLGDKERLIGIVLNGANEGLEVKGKTYSNSMPPFNYLKDEEIAAVLSYVRNNFGNEAEPVTAEEVKAVRENEE
ncbi:cytochrome c [Zunongwangia sp. F363]|uniref:Cytochrome c n=1 Tax=Autumnicola tepida TaxID=3075595 RepID=A0ABU3CCI6_9FLAO|nr:cytochrome c [Zunongwangia sp. F363]MDT0643932.1 cytochrome c [Zunongwangia sp. F363]